jgi:hypothetical protein
MAKALFGHVGTSDVRSATMASEVRRLRDRVRELEDALERECRANDELTRRLSADVNHELRLLEKEPALT